MVKMDPQAKVHWSEYLREVRLAMSVLPDHELDEIIQELQSHLSKDTDSEQTVLSEHEVTAVIKRLGTARSMAEAYGIEPVTDARPSSLDLSLLFSSLILIILGWVFPVLEIVLLPASVVLARTAIQKPGVSSSPYRFIGYPALVIGYLVLVLLVLLWPLFPVLPIAAPGGVLPEFLPDAANSMANDSARYWTGVWTLAVLVTGIWWLILRRLLRNRGQFVHQLFQPFSSAEGFSIAGVTRTLYWGGILLLTAAVLLIALINIL